MNSKALQHFLRDSSMFLYVIGENQDIIQVHDDMLFSYEVTEDVIYHCLEGCWCIAEAEIHYFSLKKAAMCNESRFPFIIFSDANIIVTPT